MKTLHTLLIYIALISFFACSGETEELPDYDGEEERTEEYYRTNPGRRTIIAYVIGDNNLSGNLSYDVKEMVSGSKDLPEDCRLLVFADFKKSNPYILRIEAGKYVKVREYANDFYATSPDSMANVYQWIVDNYPSAEYATVISGHGRGAIIRNDTVPSKFTTLKAFGPDATGEVSATSTSMWMNLPSLAYAFNHLRGHNGMPLHFSYIFFDCCCSQTIETAYELRNNADYIVSPVSETPGEGADYENMMGAMAAEKDKAADSIVTVYAANSRLCISAIRTEGLEELRLATRKALGTLYGGTTPLSLKRDNCIYYYKGKETDMIPVLHDMKHIMRINLSDSDYAEWLPYFERIMVKRHLVQSWNTDLSINFYDFEDNMTEDNYGGIAMFAPNEDYKYAQPDYPNQNEAMFLLQWTNAVGWHELGW